LLWLHSVLSGVLAVVVGTVPQGVVCSVRSVTWWSTSKLNRKWMSSRVSSTSASIVHNWSQHLYV